jgi:hypothetical protein
MSRLQNIENALVSINDAVFQELCDSFLIQGNNNYRTFSRKGSQVGKQKTTKGTPDTSILLLNEKYIFVEYTTNITKGISKLKEDIKKCLDTSKTGISVEKINEIIICVNFKINANEIEDINNLLTETDIILTLYTLDSLALELYIHHRNLVHEYLGLPIDTGQVVSIDKFIDEYNVASQGIATPLNNRFLHRENELKDLINLINQNDIIILYGSPGVGKTKLAIETINNFLKDNLTYNSFCISYKHTTLIDDLYQDLSPDKDYILFVDDANRIDAFAQIIGFYSSQRTGKLKIIVTVRDYAFHIVENYCLNVFPASYKINKLTDEQIIDIVKEEPMGILNSQFHKEIIRIAEGNPRLAIMTALLAKKEQNIYALADVSDLFEKYFSSFIKDDGTFSNQINIKILGIIAFFYVIPYKNRDLTIPIIKNFGIDYDTFINGIEQLEKLELIELQYEYVKISEQNMATYFFYKAFIKDNLLSFQTLLEKYFFNNDKRFIDCVIPANNTFGYQNVMEKLQPSLKSYWNSIKNNKERAFKLLSVFWAYLQNETFEYLYKLIDEVPENSERDATFYEVKYNENDFSYKQNDILKLLSNFLKNESHLKDALELSFEYVRKLPSCLPELIYRIRAVLTFDIEDAYFGFIRQSILFKTLITGLNNKDTLYSIAFFELSRTFLQFKYHYTKEERKGTITIYNYPLPNNAYIRELRKLIWENIHNNFTNDAFELLKEYMEKRYDIINELLEYDSHFLILIIEKHLRPDSFEHCKYVQEQIRIWKKNNVTNSNFKYLCSKYTNHLYNMYLKIKWDRLRDKDDYDFDDYKEYPRLKEAEIRSNFIFRNESELKIFYQDFVYLYGIEEEKNRYSYDMVLDIIVDENINHNLELGCILLFEVIENNINSYVPKMAFRNHLLTEEKVNYIWNLLKNNNFKYKQSWELSFYDSISDALINNKYIPAIKNTFLNLDYNCIVFFDKLKRYLNIEPKLFEDLLKIIISKNENGEGKIYLWMDYFSEYFELLGDDIDLIKKAYIQQVEIKNQFDYKKEGFIKILTHDVDFLIEYVESLYTRNSTRHYLDDDHELGIIWQVENIESILSKLFDLTSEKEDYTVTLGHFCNSFFWNLQIETKERAKCFLLNYCKNNYKDDKKINIVVDIVRHSMSELYNEILLSFLSLTQDPDLFSRIYWSGMGCTVFGDTIMGDIKAAEWRNILSIVEKSDLGIKLFPIKQYINSQIEYELEYANWERRRRFFEKW